MSEEKKEKFTLINKIVKARDLSNGIDNSGVIQLMYPDFIVKDEIFFDYENSVIVDSKYSPTLRSDLEHGTKRFIAICDTGIPDIDFTDRETILQVLKDRHRVFNSAYLKYMAEMGEEEFWQEFKRQWVIKDIKDNEDVSGIIFELYKSLSGRRDVIFNVYFKMKENGFKDGVIFSIILNFIDKSFHPDKVSSQSGYYLGLLRKFRERHGVVAQNAVRLCNKVPIRSESDKQYRTLLLLNYLGKGAHI